MRFLRLLCLLAVLMPSVAMAIPCCDEGEETECCGPAGDCPTAPSGECMLTAGSGPGVAAIAPSLEAPAIARVMHAIEIAPNVGRAGPPPLQRHVRRTPLYIDLSTLRN